MTEILHRNIITDLPRPAFSDDLSLFFTLSSEVFCIIDLEGNFKRINPSFIQLLQHPEAEIISKPFHYFIEAQDARLLEDQFTYLLNETNYHDFEARFKKKDGTYCWISWSCTLDRKKKLIYATGKDITQQKAYEQQLLTTNDETTKILESIADGFFVLDRNWIIKFANKRAEDIAGIKREDGIGKLFWDLFPEAKESIFHIKYNEAFDTQLSVHFEAYYQPLDMWFDMTAYPSKDILSVYVKDITQRKLEQESVKEVNRRYQYVSKATSEAIWEWEVNSDKAFYYGENFKKLFGYDVTDNYDLFQNWMARIEPEDRERVAKKYKNSLLEEKEYWNDQYWFKKANGEYAYVNDRAYIVRDGDGLPVKMIGAMDDITAQKLAEDALIQSEKSYKALFNNGPLPQWIYDIHTLRFLNVNDAAIRHYGYSIGEFLQKTILDIREDGEKEKIASFVNRIDKYANPEISVWKHKKKNGQVITVEVTYADIQYKGQVARLITVNDITEKIKLQEELTQLKIRKQKKIAQATIVAQENERQQLGKELHDNINQVLTTTKLYLELARTNEDLRMNLIERGEKNLINIINELRYLSKSLVPPTLHDVGVIDALQELIESYLVTQKFKVSFHYSGFIERLDKDVKLMIFRIVQEQLNNIAKHSNAKNVWINLVFQNALHLEIKDDGDGFDVAIRRKGLGLNNISNRVELYNGQILINSSKGEGCNIIITIPLNNIEVLS